MYDDSFKLFFQLYFPQFISAYCNNIKIMFYNHTNSNSGLFAFLRTLGIYLASLILVSSICSCGGNSNPPSTANHIPINTTAGWSDSPFISRDGTRLYFMYSRYDFGPWLLSGGNVTPVASGPDRPGLHKSDSNAFDESDIYVSTKNPDGSWSEAVNLGLNGAYGDSSGMEINTGNTFIWLQGNGTTNNIVIATKNLDGSWGAAVDLGTGINDHTAGLIPDNPHITPDGNALWFTSSRAGGQGEKDIWFSTKSGASWTTPLNVGSPVNTGGDEDQIWVSPTASNDVYWRGPSGLMHCVSNGSNCSEAPTIVYIPGCAYAAEVSLPDDGNTMYFACGDLTTGRVKIMYSVKQLNGSWGTATPID